jgi:hypothetical protein
MINEPKTLEEFRKHRYNIWGGNPKGYPYCEGDCAAEVFKNHLFYQCVRKNGKGLNGLYCGIHARRYPAEEVGK